MSRNIVLLAIFIILALTVILVISNLKINQKRIELNQESKALEAKKEELEKKKGIFEEQFFQQGDIAYLEEIAREKLNLQKPGEKVVSFPIPEIEEKKEEIEVKKSFWQKILEFLRLK